MGAGVGGFRGDADLVVAVAGEADHAQGALEGIEGLAEIAGQQIHGALGVGVALGLPVHRDEAEIGRGVQPVLGDGEIVGFHPPLAVVGMEMAVAPGAEQGGLDAVAGDAAGERVEVAEVGAGIEPFAVGEDGGHDVFPPERKEVGPPFGGFGDIGRGRGRIGG